MNDSRSGPIAGGILGLCALVGVTIKLLVGGPASYPDKVASHITGASAEVAAARYREPGSTVAELLALVEDPGFAKLPAKQQAALRDRLSEMTAYRDFSAQLDQLPALRDLHREQQLVNCGKTLESLRVPPEFENAWSQTPAVEKQLELRDDIAALRLAVRKQIQGYASQIAAGKALLKDSEGANLPERAKKILDEARQLPIFSKDNDKQIPGSKTLTYATVFGFDDVRSRHDDWQLLRKPLLRVADLGQR